MNTLALWRSRLLTATFAFFLLSAGAILSPADEVPPGVGVQVGDLCLGPGDPPPRAGLICRPAFVTLNDELREEWEYESGHVLNGRKGDSILSAGCGMVANLLKQVDPQQKYSHAGILVEDRFRIRHSTASEERLLAYGAGTPEPGAEGLQEGPLQLAWPGTITEWIDDAFEGGYLTDPESGASYHLKSFNTTPLECGSSGGLVPDTVLKPPPLVDADFASGARARLTAAADAALAIDGHYRFFGYSHPADVLYTPVSSPDWANGTVGSVCSAFVWRAMKDANLTLEGDSLEPADVAQRGAQVDAQTPDGLYLYTEAERKAAGEFLYGEVYEMASKEAGGWDIFLDAADDTGNQVANCFAFDWCGETFSSPAAAAGCDPDDDRAQDSPCWRNEGPGVGRAVSPDNMMSWDAAPEGPYGYREDVHWAPGGYYRVYRWGPADGTATLQGTVSDTGSPSVLTPVTLEGLAVTSFTDLAGGYHIDAVPHGPWTVRACSSETRGAAEIVTLPSSGTVVQNLDLAPGCDQIPDPGKYRRQVRIHGTVSILDTEDFGDDEYDTWSFDETHTLEPSTEANPGASQVTVPVWKRCTGNEVVARLALQLALDEHELAVKVMADSRMYEGSSCDNDDLDDTTYKELTVPADLSLPLAYVMDNEEGGEDKIYVNLSVENLIAP